RKRERAGQQTGPIDHHCMAGFPHRCVLVQIRTDLSAEIPLDANLGRSRDDTKPHHQRRRHGGAAHQCKGHPFSPLAGDATIVPCLSRKPSIFCGGGRENTPPRPLLVSTPPAAPARPPPRAAFRFFGSLPSFGWRCWKLAYAA